MKKYLLVTFVVIALMIILFMYSISPHSQVVNFDIPDGDIIEEKTIGKTFQDFKVEYLIGKFVNIPAEMHFIKSLKLNPWNPSHTVYLQVFNFVNGPSWWSPSYRESAKYYESIQYNGKVQINTWVMKIDQEIWIVRNTYF